MTSEQIRIALLDNPTLLALAKSSPGEAAIALSTERVEWVPTEIGTGTVIDTLGIQAGNAVLDVIKNAPDYRYVWALIEQGRLRLDWQSTRDNIAVLVGMGIMTQEQADLLLNRARSNVNESVSWIDVMNVAEGI